MRSAQEMKQLILTKAMQDDRIRAVLLNGSRVNPKVVPDAFQDFDVVYIVKDVESFLSDHRWTDYFGPRIIWQLPDAMTFGEAETAVEPRDSFGYLMLFQDHNRIDLTLFPLQKVPHSFQWDSLTTVWLDKDGLFPSAPPADDRDYWVRMPTQTAFTDCCNEFWWVSTYVVKGLAREELSYAKEMMDKVVRPMFMNMLAWKMGMDTDFRESFGKAGKFMRQQLAPDLYARVLLTYSDHQIPNNWRSLFQMMEIFGELAQEIADKLGFTYLLEEEQQVRSYAEEVWSYCC